MVKGSQPLIVVRFANSIRQIKSRYHHELSVIDRRKARPDQISVLFAQRYQFRDSSNDLSSPHHMSSGYGVILTERNGLASGERCTSDQNKLKVGKYLGFMPPQTIFYELSQAASMNVVMGMRLGVVSGVISGVEFAKQDENKFGEDYISPPAFFDTLFFVFINVSEF